ncbi:thioredoxin [Flaviaesturariibacter aridisoli]|uniref:Thioredoxin n=1 Tax=Flaviaesturariibacter aridisoli TaxID=2545761 RepID=A0A4R4E7Q5_9BACT|nr:thioredoxin [Flaviaesturariibacter aridisoli]TCZ74850.1 thioredoxin [Flaviaesturariibacter aridisoli]
MKRLLAVLAFFLALTASAQRDSLLLNPNDFAKKVFETPAALLLDVRTPEEFGKGHLKDARNINWNGGAFEQGVASISKNTPLFVYCLGGGRSAAATARLRSLGYTQVYELDGGIMNWRKAGLLEEGAVPRGMTTDQYNALLQSDKLVLVDFYAEWCGPCKVMAPYLEEIRNDQAAKVEVIRIDVDQNPELAKALEIRALPTLVLYKKGKVKWWNVGYVPKKTVLKQIK